jgi:hypothetical protein
VINNWLTTLWYDEWMSYSRVSVPGLGLNFRILSYSNRGTVRHQLNVIWQPRRMLLLSNGSKYHSAIAPTSDNASNLQMENAKFGGLKGGGGMRRIRWPIKVWRSAAISINKTSVTVQGSSHEGYISRLSIFCPVTSWQQALIPGQSTATKQATLSSNGS